MKYKVGDKVKIKTLKKISEEYDGGSCGSSYSYSYDCGEDSFNDGMEKKLSKHCPDRILTIERIGNWTYRVEELSYNWTDEMIEYSLEEYERKKLQACEKRPVVSRYELLDFED
jgi:hypothetical protein